MDYEKKYNEALERAKYYHDRDNIQFLENIFPELKESEDERIRKGLIDFVNQYGDNFYGQISKEYAIAWLEKQGTPAKLREEEQNRFAKCVLSSCALSFIDYLDAHKYEGKMCVSNGECEDIENAFHNAMWDRLHRYYCKYIEKQGEQKPIDTKDLETAISNILKCYSHIILHRSLTQDELNETDVYAVENTKKLLCFLEQKSADKVEPKFKVENWYQCTKDFFGKGVSFDKNTAYYCAKEGCLQNEYGCHIAIVKDLYDNFKLWTIQDAKDGDVLAAKGNYFKDYIFIYSKMTDDDVISTHCGYDVTHNIFDKTLSRFGRIKDFYSVCPATKEQRDTLFSKMKEEGYVWLSGKKRLVKLLFKEGDTVRKKLDGSIWHINYINEHGYWGNHKLLFPIENQNEFELVKQKPWSEEVEEEITVGQHKGWGLK